MRRRILVESGMVAAIGLILWVGGVLIDGAKNFGSKPNHTEVTTDLSSGVTA